MRARAHRVEFTRSAEREFRALAVEVQRRIAPKIDSLGRNPRPRSAEKLKGADSIYRIRVGDYRILYEIRDRVLVVLVIRIAHRRDVYRH